MNLKFVGLRPRFLFLINICHDKDFRRGNFDTSYLEQKAQDLMPQESRDDSDLVAAIAVALTNALEE